VIPAESTGAAFDVDSGATIDDDISAGTNTNVDPPVTLGVGTSSR
jgi:hypothetical protein